MLDRASARSYMCGCLVAVICWHNATAQPVMPLEPGWTVRMVVGDNFTAIRSGLDVDPLTQDLFITGENFAPGGFIDNRVYRVTQTGVPTAIHSQYLPEFGYLFGPLAFDVNERIAYFVSGGHEPTNLRKIDEFGSLLENITAPQWLGDLAIAPNGRLYATGLLTGDILRYDAMDDSFTVIHPNVGQLTNSLTFDLQGNAYVADFSFVKKIDPLGVMTTLAFLPTAVGVTFGDDSVFTYTNTDGRIWRVSPLGGGASLFATGHGRVQGLQFGANGRLYVTEQLGRIWEYAYVPEPSALLGIFIACSSTAWFRQRKALS